MEEKIFDSEENQLNERLLGVNHTQDILNEGLLHTELNDVLNKITCKYHPQIERAILKVQQHLQFNMRKHSHGHTPTSKIFVGFQKLSRILLAYINIEKIEFFQELCQIDLEDEISLLTFDSQWLMTMQYSQERRQLEIMTLLDGLYELVINTSIVHNAPEGFKELVFHVQDFDLIMRKYAHYEHTVLYPLVHDLLEN